MTGKINDGDEVIVWPIKENHSIEVGDIVLCKVKGRYLLHLVKAISKDRYLIGNNKGKLNGWTPRKNLYGRVMRVRSKLST